jgi:hypothetical protein
MGGSFGSIAYEEGRLADEGTWELDFNLDYTRIVQ